MSFKNLNILFFSINDLVKIICTALCAKRFLTGVRLNTEYYQTINKINLMFKVLLNLKFYQVNLFTIIKCYWIDWYFFWCIIPTLNLCVDDSRKY